MSDRASEARAEAERQAEAVLAAARPTQANRSYAAGVRAGTLHGAEWAFERADANPKPHTITRAELDEAATRFAEVGVSGDWVSLEDMLVVALGALGIEVEDHDE